MKTKFQMGLEGQLAAEEFLQRKGYRILERNYRIRTGEVDLIALHGTYIIFVEVKFRRNLDFGLPREAVTKAKMQQIIKTAMHYITKKALHEQDIRFDVIEVLEVDNELQITHIENAFDAGS